MRKGAVLSGLLHVAIALVAIFGLPSLFNPPEAPQPIPVEVVTLAELTTPPKVGEGPPPAPPGPPKPGPPRPGAAEAGGRAGAAAPAAAARARARAAARGRAAGARTATGARGGEGGTPPD